MPSATNTTNWSSEGYDADALGDDLTSVLEIGGSATKVPKVPKVPAADVPTTSTDTDKEQEKQEDDPLQKSEQFKVQGNTAFVNKEWLEAVDRYTEATEACPGPYTGADLVKQQHEWQEAENVRLRRELNEEDVRQRQKKQAENSKKHTTSKSPSVAVADSDADADAAKEEKKKEDEDKQQQKEPRREFSPAEPHPHATKLAVYHCNRAAAYLHLEQYELAVTDTTIAILLNPAYVKAYMRRSAAYEHTDRTDQALTDAKRALELSTTPSVQPPLNIRQTVARLQKLEDARLEKLKVETMDKLKDLGNSILGNFGLSMDNFKAKQDPNTGSYSISFDQGK